MEEKIKCPNPNCDSKEFVLVQEGKKIVVNEKGNIINKDYIYRCVLCHTDFKSQIGPYNTSKKLLKD